MLTDFITIVVFGLIGFAFSKAPASGAVNRLDVVLVVLLIVAANIHGSFGYFGFGEYHMNVSQILQGLIGGVLIRRLTPKVAALT